MPAAIDPTSTLAELVSRRPELRRELERLGFDPAGRDAQRSLRDACLTHGLDLEQTNSALAAVAPAGTLGRRAVVKGAAVGAGVAWVAPQVLSVPAASAATGPPVPGYITCSGAHSVPGNDLTISLASLAGVTTGDLLVALAANHIDAGHTYTPATPTGWTLVAEVDAQDPTAPNDGVCTKLFTHVVAGGDTDYVFTLTPSPVASSAFTVLIVAFSGVAAGSPLDPASPATATAITGDSSITVGGISPSIPEVLTVAMIGSEGPEDPWTPPTGYTDACTYSPNSSVPAIYAATASLGTTTVPSATFLESGTGHPDAAYLFGLTPV